MKVKKEGPTKINSQSSQKTERKITKNRAHNDKTINTPGKITTITTTSISRTYGIPVETVPFALQ